MAFGFKTKQKSPQDCPHTDEVKIEFAGLSRSVCESCGRVSVSNVGSAYPPELAELERGTVGVARASDG